MLLACLLLACQKEDGITPGTGFENLYTIQDDPNDSIQHKRYELYTTYGVPVFFNDTIGKVFVKTDVNGDSVFRYETLELGIQRDKQRIGHLSGDPADRSRTDDEIFTFCGNFSEKQPTGTLSICIVADRKMLSTIFCRSGTKRNNQPLPEPDVFLDKSDKRRGYAGKSRRLPE